MKISTVECWRQFIELEEEYFGEESQEWMFRSQPFGECGKKYHLKTSLERACEDFDIDLAYAPHLEKRLLRDFVACYHLYSAYPSPQPGETHEWLTLMRHFGAPTRLLDFTYSLFIALFFAATEVKRDSVIWAIDKKWMGQIAEDAIRSIGGDELLREHKETRNGKSFNKIFVESQKLFVSPTNPIHLNQRLNAQQGVFLTPGNISQSFMCNIEAMESFDEKINQVIIVKGFKKEALSHLMRMGIEKSVLFPDLEGFGTSMREKLLFHSLKSQKGKTSIDLNWL